MSFVFGVTSHAASSEVYWIEHDGLDLAMMESYNEFEDITGRVPLALSAVNEMWASDETTSVEDKEIALEGVIGDVWTKIKSWIKKIWAKLKEWFNKVVDYFKTFFGSAEEFISKYEEKLHAADTSKFVYSGHKWGDIAAVIGKYDANKAKSVEKGIDTDRGSDDPKALDEAAKKHRDYKKEIDKEMGCKSISDMKNKIRKEVGADKTVDIRGLSGVASVGEMIKTVTDKSTTLSDLQDTVDAGENLLTDLENEVEAAKKIIEGTSDPSIKAKKMALNNLMFSAGKYRVSYHTAIASLHKDLASEQANEYLSVLRSLARYKIRTSKEGFVPTTEGAGSGLLDAFSAGF